MKSLLHNQWSILRDRYQYKHMAGICKSRPFKRLWKTFFSVIYHRAQVDIFQNLYGVNFTCGQIKKKILRKYMYSSE